MSRTHSSPNHSNPEPKSEVERLNDAKRAEENKRNPDLNNEPGQHPDPENVRRAREGVQQPDAQSERQVEVKLLRGYVPRGAGRNASGGYDKVQAGEIVTVPASEAAEMCDDKIAEPTRNSFR